MDTQHSQDRGNILREYQNIPVATEESIRKVLENIGLPQAERLPTALAQVYTKIQFDGWKARKASNQEPHPDLTGFAGLKPEWQENIARLAEVRLIATKHALTPEGLNAYLALGQALDSQVQNQFQGDIKVFLDTISAEIDGKIAEAKPQWESAVPHDYLEGIYGKNNYNQYKSLVTVDVFEKTLSDKLPGGTGAEGVSSFTQALLYLHHGVWRANLTVPSHEFNMPMDDLPTLEVINQEEPAKSRPQGHRIFSDKANSLGYVGQLIALARTLDLVGAAEYLPAIDLSQVSIGSKPSLFNPEKWNFVRQLDASVASR